MKEYIENMLISVKNYFLSPQFWLCIIAVALAILLYVWINRSIRKNLNKKDDYDQTLKGIPLVLNIIKYIILTLCILFVLEINGINVTAIISGLGILGIIVGFALQDELQDVIMGFAIMRGHFFKVGDIVRYGDIEGAVIKFDLKRTVLEDIHNKDKVIICNRNISEITLISENLDIQVRAPYDVPAERMRNICTRIAEEVSKSGYVRSCVFEGTDGFTDQYIIYNLDTRCEKDKKDDVLVFAYGIIQDVFDEENITLPAFSVELKKEKQK